MKAKSEVKHLSEHFICNKAKVMIKCQPTSNACWTFITDRNVNDTARWVVVRNEVNGVKKAFTVTWSLNTVIERYHLPAHYMVFQQYVMC